MLVLFFQNAFLVSDYMQNTANALPFLCAASSLLADTADPKKQGANVHILSNFGLSEIIFLILCSVSLQFYLAILFIYYEIFLKSLL